VAYTELVHSAWEAIFMLLVLKIPLVYLGLVVWWAIRAEPEAGDGHEPVRSLVPLAPCGWDEWRQRPRLSHRVPRPFRPIAPHARRLVAEAEARKS
jgi:hypothetical protein